jgi:hypothetical protein
MALLSIRKRPLSVLEIIFLYLAYVIALASNITGKLNADHFSINLPSGLSFFIKGDNKWE